MTGIQSLGEAAAQRWTGIYLRFLAGMLAYGALVHIGNMLGLGGQPWGDTPLHWRVMDVVLLVFDLVVGAGLWMKKPWAVLAFVGGMVLFQIIPYTVFRHCFVQTPQDVRVLNSLVSTELILLVILAVLILVRK